MYDNERGDENRRGDGIKMSQELGCRAEGDGNGRRSETKLEKENKSLEVAMRFKQDEGRLEEVQTVFGTILNSAYLALAISDAR